jgi:hypothetical protein
MSLCKTICATILLCTTSTLFAVPVYWVNSGQGLFSDSANWLSNGVALVPTASSDARVNNGGTAVIDSTMAISVQVLQIGDTNSTTGFVQMTGGSLTQSSDLRAGGNSAAGGGTGVFELDAGTVLLTGGNLNVGFGTTAVGTYNIFGGSIQVNTTGAILAVGNRGTGTVNQTNGSIYLRTATSLAQLGRNAANATSFGTYHLSGGTLAAARFQFGNANGTTNISTNIFNLSGTGTLICNSISNINPTAVNSFNFTGGTMTVNTSRISITNNGGVFSPSTPDFANANGTNLAALPIDPIGTATFLTGNTYIQGANGTLAIDIAGDTSFDFITIDTNAPFALGSSIDGTIAVNLLNGYVPALGKTFDVLKAVNVTCTANANANNGAAFSTKVVDFFDLGGIGYEKLRLTVTTQPVVAPQLSAAVVGNSVQVAFTNTPGHTFSVVASSTVDGSFTKVGTATESPAGQYQYTDTLGAARFYRVTFP